MNTPIFESLVSAILSFTVFELLIFSLCLFWSFVM
jgi:hypothetical protein